MSPPQGAGKAPVITASRVVAGVCLFVPFVALLWVGSYDSVEPTLIGVPFFYWYQMLWVPIATVMTGVAYVLVRRERTARRAQGKAGESA